MNVSVWRSVVSCRPLLAMSVLLLASCASQSVRVPAPAGSAPALRVATWNMEHLAEADGVGCRPRQEADYAQMRDYVAQVNADVFAFAEVESAAAAARVFPADQYTVVFSSRPPSGRDGECRGQPGQHIRNQGVGFAVRKDLQLQRNPDLKALALDNPNLRWGVDISVHDRSGRPLRLLALHLKSGCFDKADPTPTCKMVFRQADVLQQWIAEREADPSVPYLLLGDWNRRLGEPGDRLWRDLRRSTAAGVMLKDVPAGRRPACSHYDAYIDHIVLSPTAARDYREGSFVEHTYERAGQREHLSDHCALSIELGAAG